MPQSVSEVKYVYGDEYWDEAVKLAKSEDINILRDRELETVALSDKKWSARYG